MPVVILTLFCRWTLLADNDGPCGIDADMQRTLLVNTVRRYFDVIFCRPTCRPVCRRCQHCRPTQYAILLADASCRLTLSANNDGSCSAALKRVFADNYLIYWLKGYQTLVLHTTLRVDGLHSYQIWQLQSVSTVYGTHRPMTWSWPNGNH